MWARTLNFLMNVNFLHCTLVNWCVFVVVLYKTFVFIFNPQEVWKSVWDRSAIKEWEKDCMCDCGCDRCVYVEWGWFCCLVHTQRKSDPVFILTGNKWMIKIDIPTNVFFTLFNWWSVELKRYTSLLTMLLGNTSFKSILLW